jgi:hypothetical protein
MDNTETTPVDDVLQFISGADIPGASSCENCDGVHCQGKSEEAIPLGLEEINTGEPLFDEDGLGSF